MVWSVSPATLTSPCCSRRDPEVHRSCMLPDTVCHLRASFVERRSLHTLSTICTCSCMQREWSTRPSQWKSTRHRSAGEWCVVDPAAACWSWNIGQLSSQSATCPVGVSCASHFMVEYWPLYLACSFYSMSWRCERTWFSGYRRCRISGREVRLTENL